MIKAVIFDCFGVILGDAKQLRLSKLDHTDPKKAEEVRALYRAADRGFLTNDEILQATSELFGIEPEEFAAEQDTAEVQNTELLDFIMSLRETYKVGMLSNVSSRERLGVRFEKGQLEAAFHTVVASGEEGYVKPQPEIYEIAATRLGVLPSECVMIDDIESFCEGARSVGMRAIQYTSNHQAIADLTALIDRGQ